MYGVHGPQNLKINYDYDVFKKFIKQILPNLNVQLDENHIIKDLLNLSEIALLFLK